MKTILLTVAIATTALISNAQTLNKTVVETYANLSANSGGEFKLIDNQLYYYFDSSVVIGNNYTYDLKIKKLNPTTNKLEPFAHINNIKYTAGGINLDIVGNNVFVHRAKLLPSFSDYRNYVYGGAAPNLHFIDSMDVPSPALAAGILIPHRGLNKHYLVRQNNDSVFTTDYSTNKLQVEYSGSLGKVTNLSSASYGNGFVFKKYVAGTLQLNKYENGVVTTIASYATTANVIYTNFYKNGNELYVPFGLNTYMINASGVITTYTNFTTPRVIAKLGTTLIGYEASTTNNVLYNKLIGFNTTTNTKFLIDSTVMAEYDVNYSRTADNGTYCYMEAGASGPKSIIVTDGTTAGTKRTNTNTLYQTVGTLVMCGNDGMFNYNNSTVGYEIASMNTSGTLTVYDDVAGGINGISPGKGYNANGGTFFITNDGFIRINNCNDVNAVSTLPNTTLNIYPNPANNSITIDGDNNTTYTIVNTLGQVVKTISATTTIDVSNFTNGMYIVRGSNGAISKFIKE